MRDWCRLKCQTNIEPVHCHYIGAPRHTGSTQMIHKRNQTKLHTLYASPSENVIWGYECGRVVSAGVGPDAPSRDAANRLSSQFSRPTDTRRRYGWLRMVFNRRTSSELQFGALREVVVREREEVLSRKAWFIG